jgi:uncharacterized protein YjbJ (UPF0337 family)
MNKDYAKVGTSKIKSSCKEVTEVVGNAVGNKSQESKGKVQKIAGKSRAANSDCKSDLQKLWMIS